MPKISVIVPVYNMEKYLQRCVDSLLKQTFYDIEVILVDDGSKDNTPRMCDEFAQKYSKIRTVHKENGGLVSAWKMGVEIATGQYVGFVDPDDYCDEDYYERLWAPIENDNDIDMVACGMVTNLRDKKISHKASDIFAEGVYSGDALNKYKEIFFGNKYVIAPSRCTKIIRRKIMIDNFDLFDDRITLCEDVCATFICFLDIKKLAIIDYAGYQYVEYSVSMSHGFNKKLFDNINVFFEILDSVVLKKNVAVRLNGEIVRQCMTLVLKLIFSDVSTKEKRRLLKTFRESENVNSNIKTNDYPRYRKSISIIKKLFQWKCYYLLIFLGNIWRKIKN